LAAHRLVRARGRRRRQLENERAPVPAVEPFVPNVAPKDEGVAGVQHVHLVRLGIARDEDAFEHAPEGVALVDVETVALLCEEAAGSELERYLANLVVERV